MGMVGHKTESIYRRYATSMRTYWREAALKLDLVHSVTGTISATTVATSETAEQQAPPKSPQENLVPRGRIELPTP